MTQAQVAEILGPPTQVESVDAYKTLFYRRLSRRKRLRTAGSSTCGTTRSWRSRSRRSESHDPYSLSTWCTKAMEIEPSPTAEATRLTLPPRTSPDREHAGQAGFEQERSTGERPLGVAQCLRRTGRIPS